jgi:hypothetical protein
MASQTDKKWEKYFKGREVETFVKANSSNTRGKSYLQVQNDSSNLINKVLLEHGHPITVFENDTYHYNGTFKNLISVDAGNKGTGWIHINCIDKVKDGKATINIESTKLVNGGESIVVPKLNEQENVPCKKFTSARQLAASIIEGLSNEPSVPDYILEQVVQFFYDDVDADAGTITGESKFIWNAGVSDKEKNQLAIYLGELLIGYEALLGNSSTISSPELLKTPSSGKLEYFAVPTDPSFAGVDSYLQFIYSDGGRERRLISSKAGKKGADPSLWSNIMPHITPDPNRLNNAPTLKGLMQICKAIDGGKITGGKSMRYVYRYGVEKILGFSVGPSTSTERSKNPTINPDDLYKQLKAGSLTNPVYGQVIRKAIQVQTSLNSSEFPTASSPSVLSSLKKQGSGMTSLFSRYIADKLNSEEKSKEIMRNTLIGRTIFQAYIDLPKFRKGEIFFTVKKITKADIHITGGKSATDLIPASQGTVNYTLIFSN